MLLRFTMSWRHWTSHVEAGIFHDAYELLECEWLPGYDWARLRALLDWFNDHLERPDTFWRRKSTRSAACWFRPTALAHIRHAREMALILDEHGYLVQCRKTRQPGYVVYEDEHQVVAVPHPNLCR